MVAVMGDAVALVAVKALISPLPFAAKPIAVLLFVQLKVAPAEPLKVTAETLCPAQSVCGDTGLTVGDGLTVMVNVCGVPAQAGDEPILGVTVIVADMGDVPVLVGVNEPILPVPLAASPMAVLLFDQLKVAPVVPLNAGIAAETLLQSVWVAGTVTVGRGLAVIVKVCGVPTQVGDEPILGVTVIVVVTGDVPVLVAAKAPILPVPLAAKPILGVLLVQSKVAPVVPLNVIAEVLLPAHSIWSAGSVTVGKGLTVMSKD